MTHILAISGALRRESTNTMLLAEAIRVFGPESHAFADIRFPLFDEDLQQAEGIPPEVQAVADQIARADAVLISTPEYNKNLSGVLKNALDWISRTEGKPWSGKPVAILSAAAGRAGGERAQYSLRHCMTPFNPRIVQMPEVFVANARNAFDADGRLKDETALALLETQMQALRALI